jgi:transcriptional regulator with XRE-family HTH domain
MTTHVAAYFRKKRTEMGLKLSEVALRLGYKNTDRSLSHGCNKLHKFETSGSIDIQLFKKLAAVLDIDGKTVNHLAYEDYRAWFADMSQPVAAHMLRKNVYGYPETIPVPERLETAAEIEHYAADYARRCGWIVCLVLNNRIRMVFAKDGSLQEVREEVPRGEGT